MRAWIALILFSGLAQAARQPFAVEDIWNWRTASDARISPDGQKVLWVETWNDRESNAAYSNLWISSADGRERRAYTEGKWSDSLPRWSADSIRIAWVSQRGGRVEIRSREASGGAETTIPLDLLPITLAWSPEGDRLAFTAKGAAEKPAVSWAPPSLLDRLRQPEPHFRLFVVDRKGGPARVVSAADADVRGEPSWMPDGQSILVARETGIDAIHVQDATVRTLIKTPGRYWAALASPDGGKVAYLAADARTQTYAIRKLYVMNADGSRSKLLAGQLDRDVTEPQWSSDSRTVYFVAEDHGLSRVFAARNEGTARQVTNGAERFRGFSLADDGRAVTVRSTALESGKVHTFTVDRVSQPVTLGATNQQLEAERDLGTVEEISYASDGRTIQGWLVKPPAFDAGRKYPLVLDIADDPRRMWGPDLDLRAQILAARGYVVLLANPRGSPGYGEEFGNLLRSRYPGDDFDDLLRGVEFAAARPYVEGSRLYVTGGLLAAWAIGHTERFRAAVARRPISHWTTDVATAPGGLRRAADWMGAMPWDDPEQYTRRSPISYAASFKTPTLVLAGDSDPGSEELYFALQTRKVDSAFIRIGGERPADWALELEAVLAWFQR